MNGSGRVAIRRLLPGYRCPLLRAGGWGLGWLWLFWRLLRWEVTLSTPSGCTAIMFIFSNPVCGVSRMTYSKDDHVNTPGHI